MNGFKLNFLNGLFLKIYLCQMQWNTIKLRHIQTQAVYIKYFFHILFLSLSSLSDVIDIFYIYYLITQLYTLSHISKRR